MTDTQKDRAEGTLDEAKGRLKSAAGDLTGDDQTKAEGEADQAKGKLQQGVADLKDKASDFLEKTKKDHA